MERLVLLLEPLSCLQGNHNSSKESEDRDSSPASLRQHDRRSRRQKQSQSLCQRMQSFWFLWTVALSLVTGAYYWLFTNIRHYRRHQYQDSTSSSAVATRQDFVTPHRQRLHKNHNVPLADSFGAYLMIMDDNHFLVEWMAYHWFALPLRHLVVFVDPKSRTSPLPILDRWRHNYNMTVEVIDWTYPDAWAETPEKQRGTIHEHPENRKIIGQQLRFYEDCMRHYKTEVKWPSWIILTDTDEFLSVGSFSRQQKTTLHYFDVPPAKEPGSVMKVLKQREQRRRQQQAIGSPQQQTRYPDCVATPRFPICVDVENLQDDTFVPLPFASNDFLTMRWLSASDVPRAPKNMVNIGRMDAEYFEKLDLVKDGRPHYVAPGHCPWKAPPNDCPFLIYHYSGSPKQRNFRNDPRGQFGQRHGGSAPETECTNQTSSKDLRPWLRGFVGEVGPLEAARLLEGVGRVDFWPPFDSRNLKQS